MRLQTTFLLALCLLFCGIFGLVQQTVAQTGAAVPGPVKQPWETTPGNGHLTATWTAAEGATSHQIQWAEYNGQLTPPIDTESSTTHIITGLTNGQAYHVRVRGKNADGFGEWRFLPDQTPSSDAPASAPSDLMANPGDGQLSVSWTDAPGATSHEIRYGTSSPPT